MTTTLAVLVVIAHPDDETLFAGLIHALTHRMHAIVDLVCVTNGEGGFRYSGPSEYLYDHLQLSNESIGRQHLPRIRQQELLASGRILGIRKFFFYDQLDLKYDRNVEIVFNEQWNKQFVIQQLEQTIKTGNGSNGYDIMLIMLPSTESHGHHSASGLIALETIERLHSNKTSTIKIPTIIGGSEFSLNQHPQYPSNRLAEISSKSPNSFHFNRTWTLSSTNNICDYQLIVLWACSEHKSQGTLLHQTLMSYARVNEQYFYFEINNQDNERGRLKLIENLFHELLLTHQSASGNVL